MTKSQSTDTTCYAPPGFEQPERKQQVSVPPGFEQFEPRQITTLSSAVSVNENINEISPKAKEFIPSSIWASTRSSAPIAGYSTPSMQMNHLSPTTRIVYQTNNYSNYKPLEFPTPYIGSESGKIYQLPMSSINSLPPLNTIDLNVACSQNNIEMVKCLINSQSINMKNYDGWTPLHYATWKNCTEIIKLLLLNGADIHSKISSGEIPLHWATMHNNTEICKELINRGADVNATDRHSNTPLHYATSKHNIELMNLLIANNADVNARDKYGNTPLHRAACKNDIRLSKMLIDAGADIYAIGRDGESPLQLACNRSNSALISLILEKSLNFAYNPINSDHLRDIWVFDMCNTLLSEW